MKFCIKQGIYAKLAVAIISASVSLTACSDRNVDGPLPQEKFDQSFVKHFGVPQDGHTYSEASSKSFTVLSRGSHRITR